MDFFSLTELTVCETSEAKTRKMETYFFIMRKIYASILLKAQYMDLYEVEFIFISTIMTYMNLVICDMKLIKHVVKVAKVTVTT